MINFEDRPYCVIYSDGAGFYSQKELNNFLRIAVMHNKDVTSFLVIDTSRPLSYYKGLAIAKSFNMENEFRTMYNETAITNEDFATQLVLTQLNLL